MADQDYINALVKANWTLADAKAKVEELVAKIKVTYPAKTPEFRENLLKTAVRTITASKIEKIVGVCVGFTRLDDSNRFDRGKALEIYGQDPSMAIREKYVLVDKEGRVIFATDAQGKPLYDTKGQQIPVVADHREFLDPDTKKYKNNRWGSELPVTIQRTGYFVVNDAAGKGHFVRAFGNFNVKLGDECTIYGTTSAKGYITIPKTGPGVVVTKMVSDVDLWKLVNDVAQYDDLAMTLESMKGLEKNKPFVSKGTLVRVSPSAKGAMFTLDDGTTAEAIACFPDDDLVGNEILENLGAGNEVIVIARTGDMEDKRNPGTLTRNANLFGFVCNPESDAVAGALDDMKDVMYS
jgi:hypothetical protein